MSGTSQNFLKYPLKREIRVRRIVQGIAAGKSYEEIAEECGVTRRTIYTDRQSVQFHELFNNILDEYLQELADLKRLGGKDRKMALQERGLLVRAMMKSVVPQRVEAQIDQKMEVKIPGFDFEEWWSRYGDVVLREKLRRKLDDDRGHAEPDLP
ncbi:MAG: helix-turn-helix domain-containing protein [Candidatus Bathyarchaeia archaeon]